MKCGACDGLWYTQKAATLDAKINIKSLKLKTSSAWIVCDNLSLDRWFSICLWYCWFVAKQKKGNWFVCWLRAFIRLSVRSVVSGGQSTFAIALCFHLIIATHVFFSLSWDALVVVVIRWVTTTFALPWERNCQLFPSLSSCCICRAVTSVQSICINWNWMHQVDWIGACTRHQHTLALRTKHEHEKIHSPKERWKVRGKALFFCNNHKLWNYFTCTDNSNFPTGQSGLAVLTITKVPSCLCVLLLQQPAKPMPNIICIWLCWFGWRFF